MDRQVLLIADDQSHVIEALRLLLKGEGYRTEAATSPAGVLALLESGNFDCVLMDLNYARDTTSGAEGLDLLPRIQALDPTLPVVVMTAWGTLIWLWKPCAAGPRILFRSPGKTPGCF